MLKTCFTISKDQNTYDRLKRIRDLLPNDEFIISLFDCDNPANFQSIFNSLLSETNAPKKLISEHVERIASEFLSLAAKKLTKDTQVQS